MSTTKEIIIMALEEIGVVDADDAPEDSMLNKAHNRFKTMWDAFATENLLIPGQEHESFDVSDVGAAASYTIGAAATLATVRPMRIASLRISSGTSYDYLLKEWNSSQYAALKYKASQAIPRFFYYNRTFPNGTIFLDASTDTSQTIKIISDKELDALPALTSTIAYPPGYDDFLINNLAVRINSVFDGDLTDDTRRLARDSKRGIKRINYKAIRTRTPGGLGRGSTRYHIRQGTGL